ncbi:MAG: GNAT family N-acetyltransferase [Catenulispora sp.]
MTERSAAYCVAMGIERVVDPAAVHRAGDLFDSPPLAAPTEPFLADPTHHLLFAHDDGGGAVGMIELVKALADIARRRGCYGMWVGTEPADAAAQATYRKAGANEEAPFVLLSWDLT